MTTVTEQRTQIAWAHCIQALLAQQSPPVENIRRVMDKLHTPTQAALYAALEPSEAQRSADT
jgi:hypothetical protein